uniref:Maturation protein n=1 Tax=Marr virus TaxID=2707240 RepID=A0A6H0DK88_9VIRU|nr:MAG: maturation protein [Marr virus]
MHPNFNPNRTVDLQQWADSLSQETLKTLVGNARYLDDTCKIRRDPLVKVDTKKAVYNEHFHSRRKAGEIIVAPYIREHVHTRYSDEHGYKPRRLASIGFYKPDELSKKTGVLLDMPYRETVNGVTYNNFVVLHVNANELRCNPLPVIETVPRRGWDNEVVSSLITDMYAKANSTEWDALTTLAEARKTVSWLADVVLRTVETIKWLNGRKAAEEINQILRKGGTSHAANVWLEYRYALEPLILDFENIQAAADNLSRIYKRWGNFKIVDLEDDVPAPWRGTSRLTYEYRVSLKRRYDPSTLLEAISGVVSGNPLTTLWEIVPYSFVVDWFINIGDFIAATTTIPAHCQEGAVASVRVKRYREASITSKYDGWLTDAETYEDSYYRWVVNKGDAGLTSFIDLNWKRKLDAFALSWGKVKPTLRV